MLPRDRVHAALEFRPSDVIPLQIYPAPGGLHEHGQKLVDLIRACGHDFGDLSGLSLPAPPPPQDYDADGSYHAFRTDEWGTTWEYRIFGVWGHPFARPLDDLAALDTYRPPAPPSLAEVELAAGRKAAAAHRERFFLLGHGGSLMEKLHSIRRFEDALMDIALDTPEINRIEDMLEAFAAAWVRRSLAVGVDGVAFGDDFGTTTAPIFSPEVWRRFFKPRYRRLFAPVVQASKPIFFHSCGQIWPFLEDLSELGARAVWPQLPLFDPRELACRCRDLGLALQLHPDRGDLMQKGSPQQVRDYILRLLETFGTGSGGSWLYLEIDPGFPWPNVEALFKVAMELRSR
jgi:hypothetical protein